LADGIGGIIGLPIYLIYKRLSSFLNNKLPF
jgi:hypothetical protein